MFSPELVALLTSPLSRTTKPLTKGDIITPRNLPACAHPLSEDARIFGLLSKRREVNIRWRQFRAETKKLFPPLDACVATDRKLPVQAQHINWEKVERVERVVGGLCRGPTKTRREREDGAQRDEPPTPLIYRHPSRWIRRRYRWLLSRSPRLVYHSDNSPSLQISSRSFSPYQKSAGYMPDVDPTTMTWFRNPRGKKFQNLG